MKYLCNQLNLDQRFDAPELLPATAQKIKQNERRQVYRLGNFYYKYFLLKPRNAVREYQCSRLLVKCNLPVVEYLACGVDERCGVIVTREYPGGESVRSYYYRNFIKTGADPDEFLHLWSRFIQKILASPVYHPDFHNGNILYSPTLNDFALVDIDKVRRKTWVDRLFRMDAMRRITLEMREILDDRRMIELIRACDIPDANRFYHRAMLREADRINTEWPRRQQQILKGYPKFTVKEGDLLRIVDPAGDLIALSGCRKVSATPERAQNILLDYFYRRLNLQHTEKLAAINLANGEIYFAS